MDSTRNVWSGRERWEERVKDDIKFLAGLFGGCKYRSFLFKSKYTLRWKNLRWRKDTKFNFKVPCNIQLKKYSMHWLCKHGLKEREMWSGNEVWKLPIYWCSGTINNWKMKRSDCEENWKWRSGRGKPGVITAKTGNIFKKEREVDDVGCSKDEVKWGLIKKISHCGLYQSSFRWYVRSRIQITVGSEANWRWRRNEELPATHLSRCKLLPRMKNSS